MVAGVTHSTEYANHRPSGSVGRFHCGTSSSIIDIDLEITLPLHFVSRITSSICGATAHLLPSDLILDLLPTERPSALTPY